MEREEFEREIKSMFDGLNKKLDKLIKHLDKQLGVEEEESPSNRLLRKATSKDTNDKQYCQTLADLCKLPFGLSAKQIAWVLMYTPRHHGCGEAIQSFIVKQFEKAKDKNEYIEQIASVLRGKYTNENNGDFIEKMIARLKEI